LEEQILKESIGATGGQNARIAQFNIMSEEELLDVKRKYEESGYHDDELFLDLLNSNDYQDDDDDIDD
jgi:hypothetical protein